MDFFFPRFSLIQSRKRLRQEQKTTEKVGIFKEIEKSYLAIR